MSLRRAFAGTRVWMGGAAVAVVLAIVAATTIARGQSATAGTAGRTALETSALVQSDPSGCTSIAVNGIGYQQCGSTWYQPQFSGTSTTYVVVNAPR